MSCREDKARYLMTQSLLAAWQYNLSGGSQEEFLSVLRREKTEQTQAMKDGMEFERLVWECACGKEPEEKHKWAKGIREIAEIIRGGAYQVTQMCIRDRIGGIETVRYNSFRRWAKIDKGGECV